MRFMDNAKFSALIAFVFCLSLTATNVFRQPETDARLLVERKQALTPVQPVNALLVGGSGIHYGLNARILSEETPYQFLNLGLIFEGNSWANYLGFLEGLDFFDPVDIEVVIYSSSDLFHFVDSDEFTLTGARAGWLLFDRQSWLQKLSPDENPYAPYPVDRSRVDPETGDMVFHDGVCDLYYPARTIEAFPEGHFDRLAERAADLSARFPSAEVFFRPWPVSEYKGQDMRERYSSIAAGLAAHGVKVLAPPSILFDAELSCDAPFHPNSEGRDAMTRMEAASIVAALTGRS